MKIREGAQERNGIRSLSTALLCNFPGSPIDLFPCDEFPIATRRRVPMAIEKILTKHPAGKSGRNISRQKYNAVKGAMLSALRKSDLTHNELFSELKKGLRGKFSGNVSWYGETVKLDLEARKIIKRTDSTPHRYQLRR
jgi:hypothetical protein